MSKIATVNVSTEKGIISCSPDPVQLYYISGPHAIQWVFRSLPKGCDYVTVSFQGEPMFRDIGASCSLDGSLRILAFTYVGGPRVSKYTIRFYNSERECIAELDPGVVVDPSVPEIP
jgi:hypothetical protein